MADQPIKQSFPYDGALCEKCGYPLKGLSNDTDCPECGYAVTESSPAKRRGLEHSFENRFFRLTEAIMAGLHTPRTTFREMPIDGSRWKDRLILLVCALLAGGLWSVFGENAIQGRYRYAAWFNSLIPVIVIVLTYIEMLGVTGFSKRRGWRVPFGLAERVCCRAAIGWAPGVLIAGAGVWVLRWLAFGEPWFESLLGLVRVSWLLFFSLFLFSLLWFETLVWIGVRQVRFANAWPIQPGSAVKTAPEK